MHIIIREKRSGSEVWLSLEKVAELLKLAPEEIEWAIKPSRPGSSADRNLHRPKKPSRSASSFREAGSGSGKPRRA